MSNYTDKNIQTLAPLEGIRKKLGMYIGGSDNAAVHHVVKEIISNSIDEYLAGYGKQIIVELLADNWVQVTDNGRGIPLGKVEDVFTKLHTSGKFTKEGDAAYGASGGLNGIGLKLSVACGRTDVVITRDGKKYTNHFSYSHGHGQATIIDFANKTTGTIIKWKPDEDVFSDNLFYYDKIKNLLIDLSYITPGLVFIIKENTKTETIQSKSIADYIKDNVSSNQIISPIMQFKAGDDKLYIEGALAWTKNLSLEKSYVNLIPTADGGTHCTALKTVLTRELNKFLNSDLKGTEIRQGLVFILSIKTLEEPVFKGQSKDSLNMPSINAALSQLLKTQIELILSTNKTFFEDLLTSIMQMRKKEESSAQIREILVKARTKANPIPNKLKPALASYGAELFICEGDSAAGGLIPQRDVYKHAIMALKGKPINVLKHPLDKVLNNEEIKDLIIAMGGFGEDYNPNKCNYDKIIIMTDSDADGSHIRLLLLSFFFQFYPQLIRDGRIYIVETPLYIIKKGKETQYVFTETEMAKVIPTLPKNAIYTRMKGLGELDPKILAEFAFSENRKLKQYKMADEAMVNQLLQNFMGVDGEQRREFVS